MTALAEQQRALLEALFAWPNDNAIENISNCLDGTWARGLKAYQAHGHMLADRTLRGIYPVVAQLLGGDSFASLARAFWHAHPPERGDLAQWGGYLANFVQASDQLRDEPYLGDVARVEWALHTCAGAADRAAGHATFQLMMAHDPATLRLVLAPGCAVLPSAWPVASIVTAHQQGADHAAHEGLAADSVSGYPHTGDHLNMQGDTGGDAHGDSCGEGRGARDTQVHSPSEITPRLAVAREKLCAGVAESAVVWRAGYQPRVRAAVPGEAQLLTALLAGRSLGEAVQGTDQAAVTRGLQSPGVFDFNAWLPMAVQTGLLLGAALFEASAD